MSDGMVSMERFARETERELQSAGTMQFVSGSTRALP
jgi:hypothetical protein